MRSTDDPPSVPLPKPQTVSVWSAGTWRRWVEPFSRQFFFLWARLTRGRTLGVRTLATRMGPGGLEVMLVEHTYLHGWWLPGGGVDRGEDLASAARRELHEETGLVAVGPVHLVSGHCNDRFFPGDVVMVFRADQVEGEIRPSRGEIYRAVFFPLTALPDSLDPGCRARLAEVFDAAPLDPNW